VEYVLNIATLMYGIQGRVKRGSAEIDKHTDELEIVRKLISTCPPYCDSLLFKIGMLTWFLSTTYDDVIVYLFLMIL
jgi:hypothetical protein